MSLAPAPSLPVTVLTGFLGAGKTTLLNRLLRHPDLSGAAVIVNEFGEIGIDHLLVDRVDGDMLMLTTGCLCCAARGDLINALAGLLDRRSRREIAIDRILIETTGLADPGPVLNALLPSEVLGSACRFDRLVTVVDVLAGIALLDRSPEAMRQVALADVLIASKLDLLDESDGEAAAQLEGRLRAINPVAPILPAGDPPAIVAAMRTGIAPRKPAAASSHHAHLHGIETAILRAGAIDPRAFERFLNALLARHGADVLRLKGLVATSAPQPILINVVQHRIHPAVMLDRWPDDDRGTRLVVIAGHSAAAEVTALWEAFFGPPRIDRPDGAALALDPGPGLF